MPIADVERYLVRHFAEPDRARARLLLEAPVIHDGSLASPRMIRCAAVASGGSVERLRTFIEMLKRDWRDVIVAGEYSPRTEPPIRIRDLTYPIDDDV